MISYSVFCSGAPIPVSVPVVPVVQAPAPAGVSFSGGNRQQYYEEQQRFCEEQDRRWEKIFALAEKCVQSRTGEGNSAPVVAPSPAPVVPEPVVFAPRPQRTPRYRRQRQSRGVKASHGEAPSSSHQQHVSVSYQEGVGCGEAPSSSDQQRVSGRSPDRVAGEVAPISAPRVVEEDISGPVRICVEAPSSLVETGGEGSSNEASHMAEAVSCPGTVVVVREVDTVGADQFGGCEGTGGADGSVGAD